MNKKRLLNLVYFIFLGLLLYQIVPRTLHNFHSEGQSLPSVNAYNLSTDTETLFPPASGNAIAIFWATWCGPCKLEMKRLRSSVEDGKIPQDRIFAINPFENRETILKFLSQEKFPFQFIEAPELVKDMKVEVTPTTLLIESGKITNRSSGLSLIGIWKAELLFR
ncbi:TlpA family protein disulfide reductase [Peredibacter sp. HCB2-198]|uniref:TlpA family protein disulfide reductase n=1 Tax=Peredibacter sp. HCB2-198 TaxID=3383025 RepID=UPI0038B60BB1